MYCLDFYNFKIIDKGESRVCFSNKKEEI